MFFHEAMSTKQGELNSELAMNFSRLCDLTGEPSNPTTFINKTSTTARAVLILLVRMTGFEPTRLSTLEPETSASAVPPHPRIKLKIESGKLKII